MLNWFRKKEKPKSCSTCKYYNCVKVQGNRLDMVGLGLCSSPDVRRDCVPFGRTAQGFYRWDWPADMPYGPISFAPDYLNTTKTNDVNKIEDTFKFIISVNNFMY